MRKVILGLVAAAGCIGITGAASAAIVCNDEGDCWKVKEKYEYRPEARVRVYDDSWKWRDEDNARYRWRESGPGRGYYRGGVWIGF